MSTALAGPAAPRPSVAGQDARFVPAPLLSWDLGRGQVLRLAVPEEFDEVGRVLQSAFSTGCWVTPTYRDHLAGIAERSVTAHVWVVADAQGVLGAVLTPKPQYHREPAFTFNILGVGPRGRGRGLGERLVEHSIALARAFGYAGVEIRSSPQMTAAHALYYRHGFVRRVEWETAVVDSGQRLYAFSYRVDAPDPAPGIPAEEPPQRWSFPNQPKETAVTLENHLPPGAHDPAGDFRAAPAALPGPVALGHDATARLTTSLDALRARAALVARRLAGAEDLVELRVQPELTSPELRSRTGALLSDDWRFLARSILAATDAGRRLYPPRLQAEIDALDLFIAHDLVEGLERAIFAGSDAAARVAQRLVFARLGEFDQTLATRRYLLGDDLTAADLSLFAVLIGFDLEYRGQLGWGAASLVDYPNLWAYARGLLALPGFAGEDELVAIGLRPDASGRFAAPWGDPPPVEGVGDLREAWQEEDDRELGAA
jgi:putative glutathione S-transferase